MSFEGKTILVTGGTGSFGQKFAELVLREKNPKSVRIYDHNELAIVEMERKFDDKRLRFLIGDVRDRNRLHRAMNGVDIVVHAAALKHVPACEYNPIEAVKTNIDGATNVIDAVIDNQVERAITISTDKAVYPVNLYGATKMVAEKLFVQGNSYVGKRNIKLSCTRYGNVIGSSGSVVPLFLEQKKNGTITITDEGMTRFWITLEKGVRFVIRSIEQMEGGEIFIPKMASMKVTELADIVAPDVEKKVVGLRPGEKLHEVLVTAEEARRTKEFDDHYRVEPGFPFWDEEDKRGKSGQDVPSDFIYTSDTNKEWLSKEQMKETIASLLSPQNNNTH